MLNFWWIIFNKMLMQYRRCHWNHFAQKYDTDIFQQDASYTPMASDSQTYTRVVMTQF